MILDGVQICETRISWRVLETSHPPTYYLPRSAFIEGSLRPAKGSSFCEWKGRAGYLDVIGGSKIASAGGVVLPAPRCRDIQHLLIMLRCMRERWIRVLVDGERVVPQPGGFYGGWITSNISGPFKGGPGTLGW